MHTPARACVFVCVITLITSVKRSFILPYSKVMFILFVRGSFPNKSIGKLHLLSETEDNSFLTCTLQIETTQAGPKLVR